MVTRIIVTHGGLGQELLAAAETIVGPLPTFRTVTLEWTDSFDEASQKTRRVLDEVDPEGAGPDSHRYVWWDSLQCGGQHGRGGEGRSRDGRQPPHGRPVGLSGHQRSRSHGAGKVDQVKARKSICRAGEANGTNNGSDDDLTRKLS